MENGNIPLWREAESSEAKAFLLQSCNFWSVESECFPVNLNMQYKSYWFRSDPLREREREGNGVGERRVQRNAFKEEERERENGYESLGGSSPVSGPQLHPGRSISGSYFLNASGLFLHVRFVVSAGAVEGLTVEIWEGSPWCGFGPTKMVGSADFLFQKSPSKHRFQKLWEYKIKK